MRYINELREGDNVSEVYLCKVKNIAKTKAGKTYYSMILQDKTGLLLQLFQQNTESLD